MPFSSARAARTKTKTRLPAGRTVPRRVQRGRGHQLWRAVLGNPIPFQTVNYYPVTTVDSTDEIDNGNDTRSAPRHSSSPRHTRARSVFVGRPPAEKQPDKRSDQTNNC